MRNLEAGSLLRAARKRTGISQARLAARAGVTQSVVSAYESGARQPSLPTLRRLVEASGSRLLVQVIPPAPPSAQLSGPVGQRVLAHRRDILRVTRAHGARNVRVFGSVARGEDTATSDVDLLVDLAPGTSLFELARLERELHDLLDAVVEIVPAADLKPGVAQEALADAVPL